MSKRENAIDKLRQVIEKARDLEYELYDSSQDMATEIVDSIIEAVKEEYAAEIKKLQRQINLIVEVI